MPLRFLVLLIFALTPTANAAGLDPGTVAQTILKTLEADAAYGDSTMPGDNPPTPEYNPADALSTACFNDDDCYTCMVPAIDLSNQAYQVLARNHAWKKWVATEYKRMDAIASATAGLNKYSKMAYSLQKSRVIIPAKRAFDSKVKTAQTTTLNSLKSAFEKIGRCEAEFLGEDNFTNMALMAWQIMKVKYVG